jgi:hypothetical protein
MNTLRLSQPLFIVLVELTLLYTLVQLDIVSLPQNSQHLVVYLTHPLIWVLYQLQYAHQHLSLIEYPLESDCMEDEGVYAVQHLTYKLRIVLFAQK